MAVTDEQAATLRTHLVGDYEEHDRLWEQLDREAARTGYTALVAAAFFKAVDRRFGPDTTRAEVIEYVTSVRARLGDNADKVDPQAAEMMIYTVLGEPLSRQLDDDTVAVVQPVVLTALIADEDLDDVGLDAFMAEARGLADQWLG